MEMTTEMTNDTKQKVVNELDQIPQEKLPEIYDLIHHYRLGLEQRGGQGQRTQILALAGSWRDMSEEHFTTFLQEIRDRRSRAFRRRRDDESRSS